MITQNILNQLDSSPAFLYDQSVIEKQADILLNMPHAYGLTVRYAMKANPIKAILQLINSKGIAIDACSGHEAYRALAAGIPAHNIQITGQERPTGLEDLVTQGVKFCACSLSQLERYGKLFPGSTVGIRFNPGIGSGQFKQVNVGGEESSFGIRYEYIDQVIDIASRYSLAITTLHTHIGSGTSPAVRESVAALSLSFAEQLTDVTHLDLGGGFKVARVAGEKSADIHTIGQVIRDEFIKFYNKSGRQLTLEIEPGTFLLANAGSLIATIDDIVDTGTSGYSFIKLNCGMSEIIRPTMYGAQHPITIYPQNSHHQERPMKDYVVVGHSCESADLFTLDEERNIASRLLPFAHIGDTVVIGGAGAYCSSMSTKHYNSYPCVAEYLYNGESLQLIKKAESREDVWKDEL